MWYILYVNVMCVCTHMRAHAYMHIYEGACFCLLEGIALLHLGCMVSLLQLVLCGADVSTKMAAEMRF